MFLEEKILHLRPDQERDQTNFVDQNVSVLRTSLSYSLPSKFFADGLVGAKYTLSFFLQTGVELELVEKISLLEWLANNYKNFGK